MRLISTDVRGGIVAPERMVGTVRYDDGVTEEYWFEGPGALATSGTPWLAALLPLAATVGERVRIDLPVDSEFLQNARVLLRLWKSWHKWAHCPEIQAEAEEPEAIHGRESATFFSAGVDSWYTAIRRHDATHWIFCLGFDMPVRNLDAFRRHQQRLGSIADRCGKILLSCATNVRETRHSLAPWERLSYGPELGMTALFLEPQFQRVFIPSSTDYLHPGTWGSHPFSDVLFSSSRMDVVHQGAERTRYEKTAYISEKPLALETLHVCWRGQDQTGQDDSNCGRCQKCLRTMIALNLIGKLGDAKLFDPAALTPEKVASLYISSAAHEDIFMLELRDVAYKKGRRDIGCALDSALNRSGKREPLLKLADRLGRMHFLWRASDRIRQRALAGMIAHH